MLVTNFLGVCSANQILGTRSHTQTDGVQRGVLEGVKSSQTDAEHTSITKKAKSLLSSVHHTLLFSYLSYHSSWIFAAAPTTPRFPFLVCLLLSSSAAVLDKCLSLSLTSPGNLPHWVFPPPPFASLLSAWILTAVVMSMDDCSHLVMSETPLTHTC